MKKNEISFVKQIMKIAKAEGVNTTSLANVHCIKRSLATLPQRHIWRASLGIILQGTKGVSIENTVYKAHEFHYTFTPLDLPVISGFSNNSLETPFLAVLIDFDPTVLSELAFEMDQSHLTERIKNPHAIYVGRADSKMINAVAKLIELLGEAEDAKILGPLALKEIFYHLLKGPNGHEIRNFVRSGSSVNKVASVIHKIKTQLADKIDVVELAQSVHMSRSLFFRYFKDMTNMSPIQYQKRLRLIEARRLMRELSESAEAASFKVGYNSPSQFSREYSRMFGCSPVKDIKGSGIGSARGGTIF